MSNVKFSKIEYKLRFPGMQSFYLQDFPEEYQLMINNIQDETLKKFYSNFNFFSKNIIIIYLMIWDYF